MTIPLPEGEGTGLGKPLKLINHPVRDTIPIFWASLMGLSVTSTAQYADGWMPVFFDPEKYHDVWGDEIKAGLAKRDPSLGQLQISAGGMVAIGDELTGEAQTAGARPGPADDGAVRRRDGCARQELLQHDLPEVRLRRRGDRGPGPVPRRQEGRSGQGAAGRADREDEPRRAARLRPRTPRRLQGGGRDDTCRSTPSAATRFAPSSSCGRSSTESDRLVALAARSAVCRPVVGQPQASRRVTPCR